MAGSVSSISIASNALILLGAEPISSFTEGSAPSTIAANLYETSYLSLLTNHRWGFATKKARLARLSSSPIDEYSYAFQLPQDLIYLSKATVVNYQVYGDKLYCNDTDVYIDYTYRIDEDLLPSYFVKMLEFFLAAQFAVSLTGDIEKGNYFSRMYMTELKRAKFADSTQTPPDEFIESPYLLVRY